MENIINRALAAIFRLLARTNYLSDWIRLSTMAAQLVDAARADHKLGQLQVLFDALVLAEDRRFYIHSGVDLRAIIRAAVAITLGKPVQGGSTISQQLVRNLTQNYARNIQRKYKEILLAVQLDAEFSKEDLLQGYLKVAYFGWRMNGVHQALRRLGFVPPLTENQAAQVIARLKYPEPEVSSPLLKYKIARRAMHIEKLLRESRVNRNE